MIVGEDVAEASDTAGVAPSSSTFNMYDTTGFKEGDQGRVPHWKSI